MQRVVALALDRVVAFDLATPAQVFGHNGGSRYRFALAGVSPGPVATSTGFAVVADHGAEVAARMARRIVVAPHRDGGQAQFVERPVAEEPREGLAATRAWALERVHRPLDVRALAAHAGVSERTFARRFRAETGTTPLQWLLGQRVLEARRLLERTHLPVEDVAQRAGFGTAASLREHFARATATTPTAYRRSFRY